MFVMKKTIKGREYLYLYKCVWRNGRSRNVFVRYLGPADRYTDSEIRGVLEDARERAVDVVSG